MKVFFGAAIQGHSERGERAARYRFIIDNIKANGASVVSEHTTGVTFEETLSMLERELGELPKDGEKRRKVVRNAMIDGVEGEIDAAVFECSVPSLGTGVEIAHAYLRPRMGLEEVPILVLYEEGYWPHHASTMIRGIDQAEVPYFNYVEYKSEEQAAEIIKSFISEIST